MNDTRLKWIETRIHFFNVTCQKKIGHELSHLLEQFDNISVYKSECLGLINELSIGYFETKNPKIKLVLGMTKNVFSDMGSRLRVLQSIISAEKEVYKDSMREPNNKE